MKKNGILNSDISRVLSYMGHTDRICIGDCGLPIPDETERIDLALRFGVPSFMEVLKEVAGDMKIEAIILAEEIKEQNPGQLADILSFYDRKRSKREPFPGIDNLSLMDIDAVPVKGKKSVSDNAKPAQKAAKPKAKKVKAEPKAKKVEAEPQPAAPVHRTDIDLDGDSKRIYEFLSAEPVHIDTIAVSLDLPVNRVLGALT